MTCLKVSIQRPGRGNALTACGNIDSSKYGADKPRPIAVNTRKDCGVGRTSAAPNAGARNGALQGVATTVANTPAKREPPYPVPIWSDEPTPVALTPNSNTPLKLRANTSMTTVRPNTKTGD